MEKMNRNDIWEHILNYIEFDSKKNLQYITSKQIKESKNKWTGKQNQFEPRLLCSQNEDSLRPKIFKDNNIFIISVKNGKYALIKHNIYIELEKYDCVAKKIHYKCESLLLKIGKGESSISNNLYYNKILEEIIGEKIKYGPLLQGRGRCTFSTYIEDKELHIKGSQYETDAAYETDNTICIIEIKDKKMDNFNIRQLYYPCKVVFDKINNKKQIIGLFIYKDKINIHIYKYIWIDMNKMFDLKCTGYYKYQL